MVKKIINIALWLLIAVVSGLVIWLLATAFSKVLDKNEIVECMKLERYSRDYADTIVIENGEPVGLFYITEWQSEMCQRHGIEINARIKR